jgi:hypothetical protein
MFSDHGVRLFLTSLGGPLPVLRARFSGQGYTSDDFAADPGYPRLDDQSVANEGRGPDVLTWRFTIQAGYRFEAPCDAVEILDAVGVPCGRWLLDHPMVSYPHLTSVQYFNVVLRQKNV